MAYLGPYPTSWQSPQMRLLPHNSLHRHSSIVTMASLDPAPASQPSLQALNFLNRPHQAQLMLLCSLSRPSSCILVAPPGPPSTSRQPLQSQHLPHSRFFTPSICLTVDPPKPSSQPFSSFYTPSSCHPVASLSQAHASQGPFQAQLLSHGNLPWPDSCLSPSSLDRPRSCLTLASLHPAYASRWPLQAQLLSQDVISGPKTYSSQTL